MVNAPSWQTIPQAKNNPAANTLPGKGRAPGEERIFKDIKEGEYQALFPLSAKITWN